MVKNRVMEKLFSAVPYFYGVTESNPNTVRLTLQMDGVVCQDVLRRAVNSTMEAFPYFAVKPVVEGEEIVLVSDSEPVVVKEGKMPGVLGGTGANGHLIEICFENDRIYVDFFHGLTDGGGTLPFLKTLLYYYCSERYGRVLDSEGVLLAGRKIDAEEIEDPYPDCISSDIKPKGKVKRGQAFNLAEAGLVTPGDTWHYIVRIKEDAFVRYSRDREGSPAVVTALLMARAVAALHPDADLPVVASMAVNTRKSLGKPKSHHSQVSQLVLEYKEAMKKMDICEQVTCFRGMVMVQSQKENILDSVRNNIALIQNILSIPKLEEKKRFMTGMMGRFLDLDTFKVSYVGKYDFGEAEKYVKKLYVDLPVDSLMMEITAIAGYFNISVLQGWKEDVYVKAFVEELKRENIDCILEGPELVPRIPVGF